MIEIVRIKQQYETKLRKTFNEKERIHILNQFALELKLFDLKKARELAEEAYHLAVPLFLKKGMAESLKIIGFCSNKLGDYYISILRLSEALELYTELQEPENIILSERYLGAAYLNIGDFGHASEHYYRSYHLCEKYNKYELTGDALNSLGSLYIALKEFDKAVAFLQEAKAVFENSANKQGLGHVDNNMGHSFFKQERYAESLPHFIKGLSFFRETGSLELIGIGLMNVGVAHLELGNLIEAIYHFDESIKLRKQVGDRRGLAMTYMNLAECFIKQGEYERTKGLLNQAWMIATEIKAKSLLLQIHKSYAYYYKTISDFAQELLHNEQMQSIEKELFSEEADKKIQRTKLQYELEQRKQGN